MNSRSKPSEGIAAKGEPYVSPPPRLQFTELTPPGNGQALEVAPGVRWCRIPMPMELDHINVWLIDHEGGCIVVDTGLATTIGEEAWQALEREVFTSTPLRGIFLTHIHPDHVGLAHWLQKRHGVPVWTSQRTHEQMAQILTGEATAAISAAEQFLAAHGANTAPLLPFLSPDRFARMTSGLPAISQPVADAQTLSWGGRQWTALETNGHAEGHLCLHCPELGVLISGDQVLPTISSNIGLGWRSRDTNPLGSFLSSLERLRALPHDTWVLPSHGVPFRGLQARTDDLRAHHLEQLVKLTQACATSKTAHDILPVLFRRPLQGMHTLLAMGEALAHLEYLVHTEQLRRETAADGVIRYVAYS